MSYEDPYERIRPYAPDELPHYPRQADRDRAAAAAGCMILAGVLGIAGVLVLVGLGILQAIAR